MITKESLKTFVATNSELVQMRSSETFTGLSVLKYSKKVFYSGNWSQETLNLRGTVVDLDFNLKALPFQKVFNRGEANGDFDLNEQVVAVRKVNGFMASVTYCPELGQPIICTTGSLDSAFCEYARQLMPLEAMLYITRQGFDRHERDLPMITYLFEMVHPEDPHVVEEEVGAYLLGRRLCEYSEMNAPTNLGQNRLFQEIYDGLAQEMGVKRPEWKVAKWGDLIDEVNSLTCKHEGYMCHSANLISDVHTLKLKSLYYSLTKFFGRRSKASWVNTPDALPPGLAAHKELAFKLRDKLLSGEPIISEDEETGENVTYDKIYDIPDEQIKFFLIRDELDMMDKNEQALRNE